MSHKVWVRHPYSVKHGVVTATLALPPDTALRAATPGTVGPRGTRGLDAGSVAAATPAAMPLRRAFPLSVRTSDGSAHQHQQRRRQSARRLRRSCRTAGARAVCVRSGRNDRHDRQHALPHPHCDGRTTASWVAEGQEISPSDPTLQELVVTPPKVAGLTIISRELADDSNPAAAQVVGDGLTRDIPRRIDQAAFAGLRAPATAGLSTLSGVASCVNASAFANLDFAAEAISKAEVVGAKDHKLCLWPGYRAGTGEGEDRAPPALSRCWVSTQRRPPAAASSVSRCSCRSTSRPTRCGRSTRPVWLVVRDAATVEADRSVCMSPATGWPSRQRCAPALGSCTRHWWSRCRWPRSHQARRQRRPSVCV